LEKGDNSKVRREEVLSVQGSVVLSFRAAAEVGQYICPESAQFVARAWDLAHGRASTATLAVSALHGLCNRSATSWIATRFAGDFLERSAI